MGLTPIVPTHRVWAAALLVNGITLLTVGGLVARGGWTVMQARRLGPAGVRLHARTVGLISVVAAVLAVLLAVLAGLTIDRRFSIPTRAVRAAIDNSLGVAQAYVREHGETVRGDIMAMSTDLGRNKAMFDSDRERFRQFLRGQASIRGLPAVLLLNRDRSVIERVDLGFSRDFFRSLPETLADITGTEPLIVLLPNADYMVAIIKVHGFDDAYLSVARPLNPKVLEQLKRAEAGAREYADVEARLVGVPNGLGTLFTLIALTCLLSSAWIGLNFARPIETPPTLSATVTRV